MANPPPYVGRAAKGEKVPQYREAFRAYVERELCPTPSDLAKEFNLHPVGICTCIEKQHWTAARIMWQANAHAGEAVHLQALALQMQDELFSNISQAYRLIVPALLESARVMVQEPTQAPKSGSRRGKSTTTLNKSRVELLRTISKTLEEISSNARALGLALPVLNPDKKSPNLGPDHAKLVQVNLQLSKAFGNEAAPAAPAGPVDEIMFQVEEPEETEQTPTT